MGKKTIKVKGKSAAPVAPQPKGKSPVKPAAMPPADVIPKVSAMPATERAEVAPSAASPEACLSAKLAAVLGIDASIIAVVNDKGDAYIVELKSTAGGSRHRIEKKDLK